MAQVKVYGAKSNLDENKFAISKAIHESVMLALEYPLEKKFHRFIPLEQDNFIYPNDRSTQYIIIEISMFEGRSIETKKTLIKELYSKIGVKVGIAPKDIEITIFETPKENWGIRGMPGDELELGYKVEV